MLQSIQYIGSGPPTYVYSQNAQGTSGEYYHVFAAETRGYDSRKEKNKKDARQLEGERARRKEREIERVNEREIERGNAREIEREIARETEEKTVEIVDHEVTESKSQDIQDVYRREYGRRESFLWKQR